MAKYGNHLNTIIKKADSRTNLSDLPEIIRPYQYICGEYDENGKYNQTTHIDHSGPHEIVGFIGRNQDMAYYFDFPSNNYGEGTTITKVKSAVESSDLRSPTIFRKYLEDNFHIYEVANVGNQSMSFSFADYTTDICFVFSNGYTNNVKTYIFYIYYYPTQKVYIFISKGYTHADEIASVYLKFTPKSELQLQKGQNKVDSDTIPLTYSKDYTYTINSISSITSDKLFKDISCYQIYYKESNSTDSDYQRIPNEYVKSITYGNNKTLNSQQISYFTQKTHNPEFIELKNQQITIEFYEIPDLKNNERLSLYVSDDDRGKKLDLIKKAYRQKFDCHTGAKVLVKKMEQDTTTLNIRSIPDITDGNDTSKTNLIYNILAKEELVYQDHLYFDINTAELYFEAFEQNGGSQYAWYPYIVDEDTSQNFPNIRMNTYLRIDYFLNDKENDYESKQVTLDFIEDDSDVTQDNTGNIPFFNYSDTFNTLPATLECTDIVFVKDSTDNEDLAYNDTVAFKVTISEDFVIDSENLSYEIVETELNKEDPGSTSETVGYRTWLKNKLTSNNIISYSKALVNNLNSTDIYGVLSSNIKNFSSFLNISMGDGNDGPVAIYSNSILSIRYNSDYDYFILKDMDNDAETNITSIDFGIGQYGGIDIVGLLAKNAIHIDIGDKSSYLPFIQYIGKDISGHPTWYIPNFKSQDNSNIPQVDICFSDDFAMNIKGFYF